MRILHLFKVYLPESFTGVEQVIWHIAESTAPLGLHTDVLTLSPRPAASPIRVDSHEVHQAKQDLYLASTGLSLSLFGQFRQLAARADIVHYHFPWPMMDLVHLTAGLKKPSVVTYHSDIIKQRGLLTLYKPLMHQFLRSASRIVATSPNYAQSSPALARYTDKLSVIPIGIAEAPPIDSAQLDVLRHKVGDRFFLFVGAFRYYKGLSYLLQAARQTGLPVVVAGSGELDRSATESLPNVTFLGHVNDAQKSALLALCTAFVFPSHLRSEAFGVALLEAARAGKPMISCEIGTGTSYVNLDQVTGIVIPPANPHALASAMTTLWSNPDQASAMGQAARDRFQEHFRAEQMGAAYASLYQHVLEHGKGGM